MSSLIRFVFLSIIGAVIPTITATDPYSPYGYVNVRVCGITRQGELFVAAFADRGQLKHLLPLHGSLTSTQIVVIPKGNQQLTNTYAPQYGGAVICVYQDTNGNCLPDPWEPIGYSGNPPLDHVSWETCEVVQFPISQNYAYVSTTIFLRTK